MKHFITGGSGFFGLHLIDKLLNENQEVVVYDKALPDEKYLQNKKLRFIQGDVLDKSALAAAMANSDVLHHNAAVVPVTKSGKRFWEINVGGTKNALESALENNVKKVIFISTSSIYGVPERVPINENTPLTPIGDYGFSKEAAENVCKEFRNRHDIDISIVRPRTIVGTGRMGIFGILFDWIQRGKRIYIIGKGNNPYQFVSARDLANACHLITVKPCKNEDFVIGAEQFGTVKGDLEALILHAGTKSKVQPTNAFIVRNILRVLDWMKVSPLVDWHYMTPHKPFYFDVSKAKRVLGWQALDSNKKMFIDAYDWYLTHRDEAKRATTAHRKSTNQGILKLLRFFS